MKRTWIIAGAVLFLVVLLGGAAYVGGQLLSTRGKQEASGSGPQLRLSNNGGNQSYGIKLKTAPELESLGAPLYKSSVFVRRSDNSIFVGTGMVKMMATKGQDGNVSASTQYDGPVVEVVVTHDTKIYRDVTLKQFTGQQPAGDMKLQQVIEAGTLDEIGENSMVQVWGTQNGDRATATVLVYSLPSIMKKP